MLIHLGKEKSGTGNSVETQNTLEQKKQYSVLIYTGVEIEMGTESRNENAKDLHRKETREILEIINCEDKKVAGIVEQAIPEIEKTVEKFVEAFSEDGRIFYVGAGTSGRLGILDAVEIPPTFGVSEDRVIGLIAGGEKALVSAQEGREDDRAAGEGLVEEHQVCYRDMVIGISASGKTPYVLGCLEASKGQGTTTAAVTNNTGAPIERVAETTIVAPTGPEVIAGSTRMKAGTAQKMILNMITTTAMIRVGKVFDNLMVDLVASNQKLKERAKNILKILTEAEETRIEGTLKEANYDVKTAILALKVDLEVNRASEVLKQHDGFLGKALRDLRGAQ